MTGPVYFHLALLMTAGVTYLIRLLPLLFIRKRIKNRFLKSFLYYVPYIVRSVMALPAILFCTDNIASGLCAAIVCDILAYKRRGLITCMLGSVIAVLVVEWIILLI